MNRYNFTPAIKGENVIYGSSRPGYNINAPVPDKAVDEWIAFMKQKEIKRICCLLDNHHLNLYENDLFSIYRKEFGETNICHSPIADFTLVKETQLTQKILPFLIEANNLQKKMVVHCSAGIGRTGQILAAWLVYKYNLTPEAACQKILETDRNPYEAVGYNRQSKEIVHAILNKCKTLK